MQDALDRAAADPAATASYRASLAAMRAEYASRVASSRIELRGLHGGGNGALRAAGVRGH